MARLILALAAALAPWATPPARADNQTPVRVGVLAFLGPDEAEKLWRPTIAALNDRLPRYHFAMVAGSAAFLAAAVAARRVDFLITNPGQYLELKVDYSAIALATEQDLEGYPSAEAVGATVIAPARRLDLQSLADLRGQKVAAVSADAFGFRAASREFLDHGVDPSKDISPIFVGFPVDGVIEQVRSGRADAGVIRSCLLERLVREGRVDADEFRVVGRRSTEFGACDVSTRLYPGWAFVKVAQTPAPLAADVARALLAMQPGPGDKIWTAPNDYQSVQDLYRALKVGPYAPFTRLGLEDLLWSWRYGLAAAAMAALWWVAHVIRVGQLIRKRERELEEAHELARLNDAKMEHAMRLSLMGEMASSLAHEINQPLAAILTFARGCERRLAHGGEIEEVREAVGLIAAQAERAGDIVRHMRDFVRKNPSRQVPVEPAAVFRDALALFEPSASARDLTVEADLPDSLPPVRADRLQIEEVTINLLQNALEAVDGQAKKAVRLAVAREGATIVAAVSDNGPGLTPEAREKLFEAFFTTKPDGLGLGLSLSRSIVEAHGGRLSADENAARGATFRFYLPIIGGAAGA